MYNKKTPNEKKLSSNSASHKSVPDKQTTNEEDSEFLSTSSLKSRGYPEHDPNINLSAKNRKNLNHLL